ncbi:Protein CBG22455 [Caenorhabditis briggsae]|uniref:Protein CBG22455 n=1 Tax=Caenorhabditis briggsae TaxID=6238 RepID=A8Y2B7_CAEBR|nr:Protein CBG22455 [Caenorhabditis briggsae]CAP39038.1 Protein CBG22455 [Caenorhabditis briggsae]
MILFFCGSSHCTNYLISVPGIEKKSSNSICPPGPRTQDPGPRTQDPGPRTQDPGPRTQDPGPRTQDPGPRTQDPGPRTPGPRTQDPGPLSGAQRRVELILPPLASSFIVLFMGPWVSEPTHLQEGLNYFKKGPSSYAVASSNVVETLDKSNQEEVEIVNTLEKAIQRAEALLIGNADYNHIESLLRDKLFLVNFKISAFEK